MGRFELADSGSLFLDEVGEISPVLQLKLLRVLQEGEFKRVGDSKTRRADVRIIAATNKDLERAMKQGDFRQDLYYRLNVIPMHIPPLQERTDDIPLLVEHFLKKYNAEMGKNIRSVSDEALALLMGHPWPGNVRELENLVERAVVLSKGEHLGGKDFPEYLTGKEARSPLQMLENHTLTEVMDRVEKELIGAMFASCNYNQCLTARKLGIHRSTFLSKLKKHELNGRPRRRSFI